MKAWQAYLYTSTKTHYITNNLAAVVIQPCVCTSVPSLSSAIHVVCTLQLHVQLHYSYITVTVTCTEHVQLFPTNTSQSYWCCNSRRHQPQQLVACVYVHLLTSNVIASWLWRGESWLGAFLLTAVLLMTVLLMTATITDISATQSQRVNTCFTNQHRNMLVHQHEHTHTRRAH